MLCFAYYCSGHGYGHATRVSAFTRHLLALEPTLRPTVYLVSSAPKHVFADIVAAGALYRYAQIDPVIVQPLAYRVDRAKSVQVLTRFLQEKDSLLERECQWLIDIKADAVLSDVAFLACLAAKSAGIPSVLISNFTFDAVYSYLGTPLLDAPATDTRDALLPDVPIPPTELAPLVHQVHSGYAHADLILLLPGYIPIPAFSAHPGFPSPAWIDTHTHRFHAHIHALLLQDPEIWPLLPSIPFPTHPAPPRTIRRAPLIVRSPSTGTRSVYTHAGRTALLASIGIPEALHDPGKARILVISFGGHMFRLSASRTNSHEGSRTHTPGLEGAGVLKDSREVNGVDPFINGVDTRDKASDSLPVNDADDKTTNISPTGLHIPPPHAQDTPSPPTRFATPSHIWIPGAPPVSKPLPTPETPPLPRITTSPPTPSQQQGHAGSYFSVPPVNGHSSDQVETDLDSDTEGARLLPSSDHDAPPWITIVCGVTKEQWQDSGDGEGLPEGFYVAPRDVYMPDLTAAGDVLLGKLGYGTVSECVDACTPFVYVSRPLFIEEHGLRLLLDQEGVGVELPREAYESGDWAHAVDEAWRQGRGAKARKRAEMAAGVDGVREAAGREMARGLVEWVQEWVDGNGKGETDTREAI